MQPPIPNPSPTPEQPVGTPGPSGLGNFLAGIRKALTAGLAAGVAAYGTAVADGSVTGADWSIIAGAVVVAVVATYLVPNRS